MCAYIYYRSAVPKPSAEASAVSSMETRALDWEGAAFIIILYILWLLNHSCSQKKNPESYSFYYRFNPIQNMLYLPH